MGFAGGEEPAAPAPVPFTGFDPAVTPILATGTAEPAAVNLRLPGAIANPGHQRRFAATSTWQDVWPGLQCRTDGPPTSGTVYVSFRLTPEDSQ